MDVILKYWLLLTPRYDVERFGIKLQGSPRHADVLIATGPVTLQARDRLIRTYDQMPDPKFVVAVGSCALSGGVFDGCYNVVGDLSKVLPVNVYIPGCPPRPEAIIFGIVQLLESIKSGVPPVIINDFSYEKNIEYKSIIGEQHECN